ncbi:MAG: transcriptional repressor [Ruminococcaceae bacterium]|nr:transcriptional repressor [Oscillospiraceae bacterium]
MKRRSTKQRETVYKALMSLYHPSAEEVYEKLCVDAPGIGRATVFRNLAILSEEGRAVKLFFPDEVVRYDPNIDGHHHFMCRKCQRIIDLPSTERLPLPKSEEFTADAQTIHFYGLCRCCTPQKNVESSKK